MRKIFLISFLLYSLAGFSQNVQYGDWYFRGGSRLGINKPTNNFHPNSSFEVNDSSTGSLFRIYKNGGILSYKLKNNSAEDSILITDQFGNFKLKIKPSNTIPWDSIIGKPFNFPTTYSLSNDVRDSVQARVARRDSLLGGYTTWLLTKKKIDSLGALKLNILDSSIYFNQVVRTFGPQTIGGAKTFTGAFNATSQLNFFGTNGTDGYLYLRGFNNSTARFIAQTGVSTVYNGLLISSNPDNSNTLPRWDIDLGGNDQVTFGNTDGFEIRRRATSEGAFSSLLRITNTGVIRTNGGLYIGNSTSDPTVTSLTVDRDFTGSSVFQSIRTVGQVKSDVTSSAVGFASSISTESAIFNLANLTHYRASQGAFGPGSSVTEQAGFFVNSNLIGAANNYAYWGIIPFGTGRWNLFMQGSASNYLEGTTLIGTTTNDGISKLIVNGIVNGIFRSSQNYRISGTTGGWDRRYGFFGSGGSDRGGFGALGGTDAVTKYYIGNSNSDNIAEFDPATKLAILQGSAIVLGGIRAQRGNLTSLLLNKDSIPITSTNIFATTLDTVTGRLQRIDIGSVIRGIGSANTIPRLTGARTLTNSNITDDGTMVEITGRTAIGGSPNVSTFNTLRSSLTSTINIGVNNLVNVTSSTTSLAFGYLSSLTTQAASFNLASYRHFSVNQGTFGAGSSVTDQAAYVADASLTSATNNFGFRGLIPSGAGRWNLYIDGTANNHINGRTLFGTLIDNGIDRGQFNGSVISTQYKLSSLNTAPSSATDTGTLGEIRITSDFIFVGTGINTWKRVAISTW